MKSRVPVFRHSGKLGDVIYALPALKAIGCVDLLLKESGGFSQASIDVILPLLKESGGFSQASIDVILPLLDTLPYIRSAGSYTNELYDLDLDEFRKFNRYWNNLADMHLRLLKLAPEHRDNAWIEVPGAEQHGKVVFARSALNVGSTETFWPECMSVFGRDAVFVGTPEEHQAFWEAFGEVEYHPTNNLLELATFIAGARLFVGNQSCPFAIAEALKIPVIQETSAVNPNCMFLRDDALHIRFEEEVTQISSWWHGVRDNPPAQRTVRIPELPKRAGSLPICIVAHDDHWFLRETIRSFASAGPVTVFVSVRAWNGEPGRWERCAHEADAAGAEVMIGDWPDESLHRKVALNEMRSRGYRHVLIPDGDEIVSKPLLTSLIQLAKAGAAEQVHVHMDTYWKSPRYVIRPREHLTPVLMVDVQATKHEFIREFSGGRHLVLGPDHGVLHHLSYAGPNERVERKVHTWSHRTELVENWLETKWKGWDADPMIGELHPTHPDSYGWTERIHVPAELQFCRDNVVDRQVETPDKWPSISVVIPLYGGEKDIWFCLRSLRDSADLLKEIIVVDDASPDQAPEVVRDFPEARLFQNTENMGFATTCNRGFEESSGEVVIFLNSDTIVPRAGLIRLIESLTSADDVAATGPVSNNVAHGQQINVNYSSVDTISFFAEDLANFGADDLDVDMLVGFCFAVKRSALDEVGTFDTRFGVGQFEDNDLSYRLRRAGHRLLLSRRAFVHHAASSSLARHPADPRQLFEGNHRKFIDKWRRDLDMGFASGLSGLGPERIKFDHNREPGKIQKEIEALAKLADVSLCMIVKDEERVLDDCLASAEGFFTQTIVVDTGSTDRTREIAEAKVVELYEFPWTDSFSEARNESLRHAKGKWIFWMDADDTLPPLTAEVILRAAIDAHDEVIGFVIPVRFTESGPSGGTQVDHVKLFRNLPGLMFEGHIHEQIIPSLRQHKGEIARLNAVVLHSGYDTSEAGQTKKRDRDWKLLKLDLEANPNHPFYNFNYGMTCHYCGMHEEAVEWLDKTIALAAGDSIERKCYSLKGVSLREMGRLEEALLAFEQGLGAVGEDPDLHFQAALVLSTLGRTEEAVEHYLAIVPDTSGFFTSIDVAILGPKKFHNLAVLYQSLGHRDKAKEAFAIAAQEYGFAPSAASLASMFLEDGQIRRALDANELLRKLAGETGGWVELACMIAEEQGEPAEAFIRRQLQTKPGSSPLLLALVRILLNSGREAEAEPILLRLDNEGSAEAAFFRGVLANRHEDYPRALQHMKRAHELDPFHEETVRQITLLTNILGSA